MSKDPWWNHSNNDAGGKWWDPDKNSFDNDLEQFTRTTGGGGCALSLGIIILAPAIITLCMHVL